ncbi:hypothetical protein [Salidesulfovibrio onnuriiensis]|uniref:hypothetical protein n=1 Tax=Salidesulfovibrio onnuriiensis TaxID=2583823 RepID=UPI00165053AA|nr:hypothetical protein [Salidesulfovibrio onnuriiensis]
MEIQLSEANLNFPEGDFAALAEGVRGLDERKRSFLPSFFLRQQKKKVARGGETPERPF